LQLRRFDEARAELDEAATRLAARVGPDHRTTLACLGNRALLDQATGAPESALRRLDDVLRRREKSLGPGDPDVLAALEVQARWLELAGERAGSIAARRTLIGRLAAASRPDDPRLFDARLELARLLLAADDPAGAEAMAREAIAAGDPGPAAGLRPILARILLCETLVAQDRPAEAEPIWIECTTRLMSDSKRLTSTLDPADPVERGPALKLVQVEIALHDRSGRPEAAEAARMELARLEATPVRTTNVPADSDKPALISSRAGQTIRWGAPGKAPVLKPDSD
jgi:hypothetical protein